MSPTGESPSRPSGPSRRVGSRHDKTGCLTCRYRRKKCVDNTFPNCGACVRLNLKCIRAPVRNVFPTGPPEYEQSPSNPSRSSRQNETDLETTTAPHNEGSPTLPWLNAATASDRIESPHHRHVFRYYVTVLANHLTVSERFNSFLSALLPMAMESIPLRDSLLAFAAGHLSLTDQSYRLAALEARSRALRSLSTSINTSLNEIGQHEANAAACLTFVIHDVGVENEGEWGDHLRAAQHIIMAAKTVSSSGKVLEGPDAFKTSSEGEWILRNFAYHDIIGCITMRRKPLLGGAYLSDIADVVDSYIGVATGLLVLAAEVGLIQDDTHIEKDATPHDVRKKIAEFHRRCASLEQRLQAWNCQEATARELAAVAYAYRSAILIILYRLVRSRLRTGYFSGMSDEASKERAAQCLRDKIEKHVESILSYVAEVPLGATPESPLLFPLFVAGGEALLPHQIEAVRSRLQNTLEQRRFRNILTALEVLKDLWRRRSLDEPDADWLEVLDQSGKPLLLT